MILNFANLEYICSAGLAAVISFQTKMEQQRSKVVLTKISSKIANLVETLGFNNFFLTSLSEQEAIKEFQTVRG